MPTGITSPKAGSPPGAGIASFPFALYFWQPRAACYGQGVRGDDEILFSLTAGLVLFSRL
ncbi:hypothetical protein DZD18_03805 [Rhodobacteraceae bacterium W635]|nr:hypothetical protein DZD18_03805 [Rhodobacteraceae bacterium W635]